MHLVLPLLIAVAGATPPTSKDPLVARVEAHYAAVDTMQMQFSQTVRSPLYGDQVQTGTVAFARPGKMRWSFTDEGKHYIGDGAGSMWVYLEKDKQAFHYTGWDASGQAESLLSSLDNIDSLFLVSVGSSSDKGHVLTLKPREEAAYAHVELRLDSALSVTGVVLTDTMETRTELSFTGVELGADLPADTFTFAPPEGVEVIEAGLPK